MRTLLAAAGAPLTRHEILSRWPSPVTRPTPNTLRRWLNRACELGVLARHGSGSKTDAFRYRLTRGEDDLAPRLPAPVGWRDGSRLGADPLALELACMCG
jgi:hypothetical protein